MSFIADEAIMKGCNSEPRFLWFLNISKGNPLFNKQDVLRAGYLTWNPTRQL